MKRWPILLLLLCASASGQTPAPPNPPGPPVVPPPQAIITAPASVPSGSALVLLADKSNGSLAWKIVSPKVACLTLDQGSRRNVALVIPLPADGVYRFALIATGDAAGTFDFDFADVLVGGGQPSPIPGPGPSPTPVPPQPIPPAPATLPRGFIVTMVAESSGLTPALVALKDSLTLPGSPLQTLIVSMGGRASVVGPDQSAEFARRALGPILASKDISGDPVVGPAVVVQDARGKVIDKRSAPADEAKFVGYLKSFGGAN